MCSSLVDVLQEYKDPRLPLWAARVRQPIVIEAGWANDRDEVLADGKRHVAKNIADNYTNTVGIPVDLDTMYIGMPPAWSEAPYIFNLNKNLEQAADNLHMSHVHERYKDPSGPLHKSRILTAAEVHFILAEAALKGWSVGGSAQTHYESGIRESLKAWGVGSSYNSYISNPGVAFDAATALEQIIEQKWIASWSAATEAWFDYRRTGLPDLPIGRFVKRPAIPVRFYYMNDEILLNPDNTGTAISNLEQTQFSDPDGGNSAWSKSWLLQGTGKPW